MSAVEMNRRKMIKSLVVLAAVSGFPMVSACQDSSLNSPIDGLNLDSVKKIGRFYLNQYPEDEEIWVVTKILSDTEQSNEEIIKQLQKMMIADFENDQIVNLFGWNVSRTEARIFASTTDMITINNS